MARRTDEGARLPALDLNLFLVLHTVLEEGSATRAARRLHVTQSAVSNALARLREAFADPLVVRSGRGLVPTPRAREIAPHLAAAIAQLEQAVRGSGFDPARTTRTFAIACSDNHQLSEMPKVARLFAERMPEATLRVVSVEYAIASGGLAQGELEAILGPEGAAGPGERFEPLFEERAAVVARRGNREVGAAIDRARFNELPWVDVHLALGRGGVGNRMAFEAMAAAGLQPRVRLQVPSFMAAAAVVAQGDAIAGMPHRFAEAASALLPLRIVASPLPPMPMVMGLIWHERTDADEGSRCFRALVAEALRAPDAPRERRRSPRRR